MNRKFVNIRNIDLLGIVRNWLRNWWIILIVAGMGIMISHAYISNSYVPEYTSSGIYVVTPKQSTGYVYTNKKFAEGVVTVLQNLMNSDIMKNKLKKELHVSNLDATMDISLIEETNLMKVSVTSKDPIISFKAIGAIMENYADLSEYLTSDAVFDALETPVVATHADNVLMPRNKSLLMGFLCGLMAMLVFAAINIMRRTIKTEAAVEEQLNTTLLGTIYYEQKNRTMKSKIVQSIKALLITSPVITTKFIEAFNNIRIKIEYEHDRRPEKNTILVSSVCENEGKSTVALNIALSLQKEGKKVIVIDADMRNPAMYKMLDIPPKNMVDVTKLLQGKCGLDEAIYHDRTGINLIMSSKGHTGTYEYMKSGAMQDLIHKCSQMADYVIVDTPPMSLVADAEAIIDLVDFSLLVVRQDVSHINEIRNCVNLMNDSNSNFLGCVLNAYRVFKINDRNSVYNILEEREVEVYDE